MAKRNYIGLSCSGHDSALAIVDSAGDIVFAEAAERSLQRKRAIDAPSDDLLEIRTLVEEYCEVDAEIVVCKTWSDGSERFVRETAAHLAQLIATLEVSRRGATSKRARVTWDYMLRRARMGLQISSLQQTANANAGRNLAFHHGERVSDVRAYEHHLTHAALGCFTSPFSEAVCVVADGMGEGRTLSCYRYEDGRLQSLGDARIDPEPPYGLGLFYADLCLLCGFDPWKGEEWKVMGLAGYGRTDASLRSLLNRCLELDGLHFGRPVSEAATLARLLGDGIANDWVRRADIAHAGQQVFEDTLITVCESARKLADSKNLVLCGGCALNSGANGKLIGRTRFDRLYIPCAPADDGNAIGAALLGYFEDESDARPRKNFQSPYLGSCVSRESLERTAGICGFAHVERLGDADLCSEVARRLCEGAVVGWVQGRAEFGPRALGNRSILADPRDSKMRDRINRTVKFREEFRPLAPAILAEFGDKYFEGYQEAPYMERALPWRCQVRQSVPATVHVDGTGRVQSVRASWNPLFHRLLTQFHERSGVPVLVNTSFNVMGKPIVHSVEDAMAVFATSGLDVLVIGAYLFAKQ